MRSRSVKNKNIKIWIVLAALTVSCLAGCEKKEAMTVTEGNIVVDTEALKDT